VSSFASLRGHLLVAAPDLLDPNFRRSVVLLTEHDVEAAMGVVLNRRLEVAVADAVPALAELVEQGAQLYQGGPVQTGSVLALADFREPSLSAGLAFGSVGYLRGDEDPTALVGDVGAVRVFSGYSGWGPGQLEAELSQDAWITLPAQPDDVFGEPDGLWSRVLERKGGHYRIVARMPDDPSVN
jgi:putative transcriptional regulator